MPTIGQVLALLVPAPAFTWWMPANPPTTITPLGEARFTVKVIRGADKWTIRASPTAVDGVWLDLPAQSRVSEGPMQRAVASPRGGP